MLDLSCKSGLKKKKNNVAKFPQGNHLSQNSGVPQNLSKTQKSNIYIFAYSHALIKGLAGFETHILAP